MQNTLVRKLFGSSPNPRFKQRGLLLDISRNRVPNMKWLYRFIDALEVLRFNELQLYSEHTFAYQEHSTVWSDASPMTAAEIRSLDAYCGARGIELVANQNSFGHLERWLKHDRYRALAECPEGFTHPISGKHKDPSTLYPSKESLDFIHSLYCELLPNFRSKQIHVGGDEPWELGKGRSQEAVKIDGKQAVYLDYMQSVFDLAEQQECSAQFWADIILEKSSLIKQLPKQVTPVIWGYESDFPFDLHCHAIADGGFRGQFYVAPGAGNWNSFSGRLSVAEANIKNAAQSGHTHGASGLLLTAWGDNGHHQPYATLYPSLILTTAACWGTAISTLELADAIDAVFYKDGERATGNGAALCELGAIDAMLPQPALPNSFLHSAYFANDSELALLLKRTTTQRLEQVYTVLKEIQVEALDPEIQLSVELSLAAIERCLGKQMPTKDLHLLLDRFTSIWLQSSRTGGLNESLQALKRQN